MFSIRLLKPFQEVSRLVCLTLWVIRSCDIYDKLTLTLKPPKLLGASKRQSWSRSLPGMCVETVPPWWAPMAPVQNSSWFSFQFPGCCHASRSESHVVLWISRLCLWFLQRVPVELWWLPNAINSVEITSAVNSILDFAYLMGPF